MKGFSVVIRGTHIFAGFLLLLVFLGSIFPITDNDVWWHLKTGQLIVQEQRIPAVDPYSFTINGRPWVTFEWLSQVVLYLVYAAAGLSGLTLFKALVAALIFLLMFLRSSKANVLLAGPLYAVAFLALRDGLRERPQLFTYLFAALYPLVLKARGRRWWYLVPLLEVLWANMHGPTAIIGFGLTVIYVSMAADRSAESRSAVITATFAAMFITPQGYHIFTYFSRFFSEGFNRLILEYRPPQWSYPYYPYFLLLAVAAASMIMIYRKNRADALTVLIAAAASLLAIRNIPIFLILSMPAVAGAVSLRTGEYPLRRAHAAIAGLLLFALAGSAAAALDVSGKYRFGMGDRYRAREAVEFISRNPIDGNMFNDYDFGGYLIWKLYPGKKVFVDGRLVEYGADFVEKTFYYWKKTVWDGFEKEYRITAAIIPQERYYNASYLDSRNDWVLVWWDDNALVYVKAVEENKGLIQKFGYRFLKPNSPRQDYLRSFPKEAVLAEIDRAIVQSPRSLRAQALKRYVERLFLPSRS